LRQKESSNRSGQGSFVEPGDTDDEGDISAANVTAETLESLTPVDREKMIKQLKVQMRDASRDLRFEEAAKIRDAIEKLGQ
jgi:excinuclease UvrABC helicase subunit UvrB